MPAIVFFLADLTSEIENNLRSPDIIFDATGSITLNNSSISNSVLADAVGDGGDINLRADSVLVTGGSRLITDTSGRGNGGLISLQGQNIEISGENTALFSDVNPPAVGNGLGIAIESESLTIRDGAIVSSSVFGSGNAGDIELTATEDLSIAGLGRPMPVESNTAPPPAVISVVGDRAQGNAGNIKLDAKNFTLSDFVALNTSNFSLQAGDSGSVAIAATDKLLISESGINSVRTGIDSDGNLADVEGNAGNITLSAATIDTELDSFLNSSNILSRGNAGNIRLEANNIELLDPFIRSEILGVGEAGNIQLISQGDLTLRGERTFEPTVSTETFSSSPGGNIRLEGSSIDLLQNIVINADSQGSGSGGGIAVQTDYLAIDRSLISATALGAGDGGDVRINAAQSVIITGAGLAQLQERLIDPVAQNPEAALDSIVGEDGNISARDFQGITAGSLGEGAAGNIQIDTANLSIADGSLVVTSSIRGAEGTSGGSITLNADEQFAIDGGLVSSSTINQADAGDINLNTGNFVLTNGGTVAATTLGAGNGGNLTINAAESIDIRGIFGSADNPSSIVVGPQVPTSTGNGGELQIVTPQLTVRDGGAIAASTVGIGDGGNIEINASDTVEVLNSGSITVSTLGRGDAGALNIKTGNLTLQNNARLSAETLFSEGGNINLNSDLLLLRENSQISTTAGTVAAGGNGGNISIDSDLVVAFASENNDITANAFEGGGGQIQISARGIFGLTTRDRLTPSSDITAFSQNPQLSGEITLNTSEFDPVEDTFDPATEPIKAEVSQVCKPNRRDNRSEFTVTGRGGLNDAVDKAIDSDLGWEDWRTNDSSFDSATKEDGDSELAEARAEPIVEAQEWRLNERGNIVLVAGRQPPLERYASCQSQGDY